MTREEALKKVNSLECGKFDNDLLNSLEMLGLIKFDEPKKVLSPSRIVCNKISSFTLPGTFNMILSDGIINELYQAGYKIIHKSAVEYCVGCDRNIIKDI